MIEIYNMETLIYITVLEVEGIDTVRIKKASNIQIAEIQYKHFLENVKKNLKTDYKLSTYKATEIIHSEKEKNDKGSKRNS